MKALINMGFGPRKSKSGFTLIELLIVMVILAILAGVVVMAVGGVFGTAKSSAYNTVKDDIQNAVTGYATDHQGNFPINSSGTTYQLVANDNCSATPCYLINMSALLVANGGMLRQMPDGVAAAGTAANAGGLNNCYGALGATACSAANHYTWGATTTGIVFSRCDANTVGEVKTCTLNNVTSNNSGYRGVWP
jgi:prepilin-type N-terminal cleavage/methylation domain-containing protein